MAVIFDLSKCISSFDVSTDYDNYLLSYCLPASLLCPICMCPHSLYLSAFDVACDPGCLKEHLRSVYVRMSVLYVYMYCRVVFGVLG